MQRMIYENEEPEEEEEVSVKLMLVVLSVEAIQGFHEQVPAPLHLT